MHMCTIYVVHVHANLYHNKAIIMLHVHTYTCTHVHMYVLCVFALFSLQPDADVQLVNSYELALRTGKNFLSTFLKK